jgi:hypothetical protein
VHALLVTAGGLGVVLSGSWLSAAAEEVGPDLTGIAAIIAASAGMISAVGALIIGLRTKTSADRHDVKDELLLELAEELAEERRKRRDPP